MFMLFSAGQGQSALDRLSDTDKNPNSVFTRTLLKEMEEPGLSVVQIAKRTQSQVKELAAKVDHVQVPAYYDQIVGDLYLAPGGAALAKGSVDTLQEGAGQGVLPPQEQKVAALPANPQPIASFTRSNSGWMVNVSLPEARPSSATASGRRESSPMQACSTRLTRAPARRLHFWDLHKRKHLQEIDFGPEYQLVFELRPAHDPTKAYGFVNCVVSLKDLSASIWMWHRDGDKWAVKKVIEIPAEPADPDLLPPLLKGFKAVPPLVTDIDLSMDDRFLYVACWGTGDLRQYDVSDPFKPKLTGTVRIGGIVSRASHPRASGPLNGGPQMVEISRDGKRVYFTNSLYGAIDPQFYPDGIDGWMVKLDAGRTEERRGGKEWR